MYSSEKSFPIDYFINTFIRYVSTDDSLFALEKKETKILDKPNRSTCFVTSPSRCLCCVTNYDSQHINLLK